MEADILSQLLEFDAPVLAYIHCSFESGIWCHL